MLKKKSKKGRFTEAFTPLAESDRIGSGRKATFRCVKVATVLFF